MGKFIDLTGQRFGRLTVVERAENVVMKNGGIKVMWKCQCDCGTVKNIATTHLRKGVVISCGCYQKEVAHKQAGKPKKRNAYVIHDDYVIFYTSKNEPFLVSIEDFGKVYARCWSFNTEGYLVSRIYGKTVRLHVYITGYTDDKLADHISGQKFDNRRSNLREATHSQNTMNASMRSDNTSGVIGVSWSKKAQKWAAQIYFQGKQHHLGYFDDINDATAARHAAEDKYFGEFGLRRSRGE